MGWRAPQEDARAESAERSEAVVRRRFCRAPQGSHWDPTAICLHMDMHMDMACLRVSSRARASCACEYARVCVWVIGLRHLRAMLRNLCFCLWLCNLKIEPKRESQYNCTATGHRTATDSCHAAVR